MNFKVAFPSTRIANSALVYRVDEYSFARVPQHENFCSVLVNDLNLELNKHGLVVSIWGLSPYMNWRARALSPPSAQFGDVVFIPDKPLVRGISVRLESERWPVWVDKSSGWVRMDGGCNATTSVKIFADVILEVDSAGRLCSIWLKPDRVPEQTGRF